MSFWQSLWLTFCLMSLITLGLFLVILVGTRWERERRMRVVRFNATGKPQPKERIRFVPGAAGEWVARLIRGTGARVSAAIRKAALVPTKGD